MSSETVFFVVSSTIVFEIFTLSLHDALPICFGSALTFSRLGFCGLGFTTTPRVCMLVGRACMLVGRACMLVGRDRKSTRLNSSHQIISYAVFCLKKKNNFHFTSSHVLYFVTY